MHRVLIALGSNHCQPVHIQWATEKLLTLLKDCHASRRLWTRDIKGREIWYMNRLVAGYTSLSADEMVQMLKSIEVTVQRTKERVTLDLDLMQYDDERYHLADWPRPYIQLLLGDVWHENK